MTTTPNATAGGQRLFELETARALVSEEVDALCAMTGRPIGEFVKAVNSFLETYPGKVAERLRVTPGVAGRYVAFRTAALQAALNSDRLAEYIHDLDKSGVQDALFAIYRSSEPMVYLRVNSSPQVPPSTMTTVVERDANQELVRYRTDPIPREAA